MLWHIELKFCIWLCFAVLQIKFECCQFASIFVGVMPLLELTILKIHSFPHFSLTCFAILSWNFAYDFLLLYYRSSSSVVNFCRSYAPFGTWNTENTQFSALLSYMLWYIELKVYICLCLNVLQNEIKFECCQFASIFVGVMHLSGLRILEIHSYIHALTNLKFHVGFFNAFLLRFRKVLLKNNLFKCSRRAYYAPFAVLRYI